MASRLLARLAAIESKVDRLAPPTAPAVTVGALWALFAVSSSERLASWRDYLQRWRDHVGPAFAARDAGAVTPGDVDRYRVRRRASGAATATVNREIALLRRVVNFGVRRGAVPRSQLHGPGMTRELIVPEDNVRTTVIEERAETGITLPHLLGEAGPQLRAYIMLVHHTGLRRGEAARLRRDRIQHGVAWIPSKETKGKRSGRVVPLSSDVSAALAALPETPTYVFESRRRPGRPIHRDVWTKRFGRLVRRLGLDGPDGPPWLHDLRRSFVTLSRRDGESERSIMNITGHKTRAVFDRYDVHDLRDILAFAARREELRASARKGPQRAASDVGNEKLLTRRSPTA
jgi:integrase